MDRMWTNVRYAARRLPKRPLFTAVVVASVVLGLTANTLGGRCAGARRNVSMPAFPASAILSEVGGREGRTARGDVTVAVAPDMVRIPAGEFVMGSDTDGDHYPAHRV